MNTDLPKNLAGIDVSAAVKRAGGSEELVMEFFGDFCLAYQDVMTKLRRAWEGREIEYIHRTAHTIKGLAGNIGASELMEAARQLEMAAKSGSVDRTEAVMNDFEPLLGRVLDALSPFVPAEQDAPRPDALTNGRPVDRNVLENQLKQLDDALEKGRFEALDLSRAIKDHLAGREYRDSLVKMDELISSFEFEAARKVLRQMTGQLGITT